MRDRETELHFYPKDALSLQGITHALCIAPHPDDEVLGCAGALALLAQNKVPVQSVIVTQGDKGLGAASQEHGNERMEESRLAAQMLGCMAPRFLHFEDRQLSYNAALVDVLSQELTTHFSIKSVGMLFLPSLSEPHPDHQAVALAGLAAAMKHKGPLRVLFYEVGAPLHPNTYLDITSVAQQKWQALACFASQMKLENYEGLSRAMATMRAFGKAPQCTAAEAYFEVDMDAAGRNGPLAAIPQWPWVRSRLQLANAPQDLPLVSILIRSMDRPSLAETLASVVQQTYPHIEVVIVNAKGSPHSPVSYMPQHTLVKIITPAEPASLGRSAAANLALENAQGSLALFLDDDDLIDPDHLQRLVQALHQQHQAVAAYCGVRVVNAEGQTLREYNSVWSGHRIQGINFLPIHAVLFRMQEVRDRQLRFDTDLPVLEDWDFWHQLSQNRNFVHSPGITATYRQTLGQSGLSEPGHDNHWQAWHLKLLTRYLTQSTPQDNAKCLAWHAIELDKSSYQLDQAVQQQRLANQQLELIQAELQVHKQQSHQEQKARTDLQNEFENFSLEVQERMAEKEAKLHAFAAQSNQALADKEARYQAFATQSEQKLARDKQLLIDTRQQLEQNFQELLATKKELMATQNQLQKLQTWQDKVNRRLPRFLLPEQD